MPEIWVITLARGMPGIAGKRSDRSTSSSAFPNLGCYHPLGVLKSISGGAERGQTCGSNKSWIHIFLLYPNSNTVLANGGDAGKLRAEKKRC